MLSKAVDLTLENIAILGALIRDGKLRALAVANKTRTPLLPDMPTMAEAGVPDAEANTFFGLVAPAGTPASIIDKLNAAMNDGMQAPDIQAKITSLGTEAKPGSPADFAAYHRRPAPQVDGSRQGRGREDRLSGVRACREFPF